MNKIVEILLIVLICMVTYVPILYVISVITFFLSMIFITISKITMQLVEDFLENFKKILK